MQHEHKPWRFSAVNNLISYNLTVKILVLLLISTALPVFLSNYFSVQNSIDVLRDNTVDSNLRVVQAGGGNVSTYFEGINQSILDLYKNGSFMSDATFDSTDYTATRSNEQTLNSLLFSHNDYTYLYYYIKKDRSLYSFSRQMYSSNPYHEYEKSEEFKAASQSPTALYISPEHLPTNYNHIGDAGASNVLTFSRGIQDISTGNVLAVFSIQVDIGRLQQICDDIASPNEIVALTDLQGRIYYCNLAGISSLRDLLPASVRKTGNGASQLTFRNEKYIVVFSHTYDDLILIKGIPYASLQQSAKKALSINTVILIVIVLAEGNLNVGPLETNRKDEIGVLINKFNEMTDSISNLINSEYKLKVAKKNAQLSALQAQINPHFMYNALQSLGTLALRRQAPEIYQMANAIAQMLRYSLQASSEVVTLQTEIENIRNYFYVQKVRFGPKLEVEIQLGEGVESLPVPKLILQPLVENSIKYGIDDEKTTESISIAARRRGDSLELVVCDNGRGISGENLAMIREWIRQEDDYMGDGNHLGIKNVYNRIKLLYGEAAEMSIESELGSGTRITVRIPVTGPGGGIT